MILSEDCIAAHQHLDRTHAATMLQKHCPKLLQPFLTWYGRRTGHLWTIASGETVNVWSERGVDQGDPLANPVFAVSMIDSSDQLRQSLQTEDADVSVIQFSDNIHICMLPSVLPLASSEIRRLWEPAGLSYKADKQTWSLSLDLLPSSYQSCRVTQLRCLGILLDQMGDPESIDSSLPQLGAEALGET